MGGSERIQFFVTNTHNCSYLENKEATAIFADPYSPMSTDTFGTLMEMGFRRSGEFIYKPRCHQCQACIPVRLESKAFIPSRSQKRVWKKNADLRVDIGSAAFCTEDYKIYESYIKSKHYDGDMHPPTQEQYQSFLLSQWSNSRFIRFFDQNKLICIAVIDCLPNGISAVYTFYHPDVNHRSMGTYSILWQIKHCRQTRVHYLYLGYWIKNCKKMSYKNQFKPFQQLIDDQWIEA